MGLIMIFGAARGSIWGVLLIVAAFYFSGAGGWIRDTATKMQASCYPTMSGIDQSLVAVCDVLTAAILGFEKMGDTISAYTQDFKNSITGTSGGESIAMALEGLHKNLQSMTSSSDQLSRMIQAGPGAFGGGGDAGEHLQRAIDSFAIGEMYLNSGSSQDRALQWLQHGAAQPEGFGLHSQMKLGSLYASGGKGVPANPKYAEAYLQQAYQSLGILQSSRTPEAINTLQQLPMSPQQMQRQIQQAIRSLKVK
jgi:hypothetical protein